MKLALVVVYLVEEDNEDLLELHLRQIERCTQVPYTVYGCVNRLLPRFRARLETQSRVRICECPETGLRGSEEHSYYLEHLIGLALADGATHVATLHVDSFPVHSRWVEELSSKLSETCVLAAIMRDEVVDRKPLTAFMLFQRDFYVRHRPTFLLSPQELSSREYRRYRREHRHHPDSGVGFGFKLYQRGLSWYPLIRSNQAEDHYLLGGIYGDCIFHLNAATQRGLTLIRSKGMSAFSRGLRDLGHDWFPEALRRRLKKLAPRTIFYYDAQQMDNAYETIRQKLLQDPDGYLHYLRRGPQPGKSEERTATAQDLTPPRSGPHRPTNSRGPS